MRKWYALHERASCVSTELRTVLVVRRWLVSQRPVNVQRVVLPTRIGNDIQAQFRGIVRQLCVLDNIAIIGLPAPVSDTIREEEVTWGYWCQRGGKRGYRSGATSCRTERSAGARGRRPDAA